MSISDTNLTLIAVSKVHSEISWKPKPKNTQYIGSYEVQWHPIIMVIGIIFGY